MFFVLFVKNTLTPLKYTKPIKQIPYPVLTLYKKETLYKKNIIQSITNKNIFLFIEKILIIRMNFYKNLDHLCFISHSKKELLFEKSCRKIIKPNLSRKKILVLCLWVYKETDKMLYYKKLRKQIRL